MKIDRAVIEINGGCNYSCQMCPQSTPGREASFKVQMSLEDFEKVVADVAQHGARIINLDGSGEATANKNFPEYVKIVKKYGMACYVFSNGYNMSGSMMRKAVDAGLDYFRFSVIGYDRDQYKKWMNVDKFTQIMSNIKEMTEYIKETGASTKVATYSLIDNWQLRYLEVEIYRDLLEPFDVQMEIWMMHNWSGVYDNNTKRIGSKKTCGRPFSPDVVVRAGGNDGHKLAVHPCCQVLGRDSEAVLGHLDENTIEEVWNGEEYNKLRGDHLSGDYPSYCVGCDFLIEDKEVLVYTNYNRDLNKMHGTEFNLKDYKS